MSITESLMRGRILVTGGRGLVGSALLRALKRIGCRNVLAPGSREVGLREMGNVCDSWIGVYCVG
jgi:GDP-L-fucose synthase